MEAGRLDSKYWRISSSVPVRSSWWAYSHMGIMVSSLGLFSGPFITQITAYDAVDYIKYGEP